MENRAELVYRGYSYTIHKVEGRRNWYWQIGTNKVEDWQNSKKEAIAAAKDYIKNNIEEQRSKYLSKKYYNSHGESMSWKEFLETEVDERDNYSPEEINAWQKKYAIDVMIRLE
jgi:hypothetical protein